MQCEPLIRLLKDPFSRMVALVGGGGKSGLIQWVSRLALELSIELIVSTTTKMRFSEVKAIGEIVYEKDLSISHLIKEIKKKKVLVILKEQVGEKVIGVESNFLDSLKESLLRPKIIVEADGSKGMPIKANLDYEPVLPKSTDVTIGIIGLDALNKPLDRVVFREQEFVRYYGLKKSQIIDWEIIARHVNSPRGLFKGAPKLCRRILLFNKADLFKREEQQRIAMGIKTLPFHVEEILLGSVLNREVVSLGGKNESNVG